MMSTTLYIQTPRQVNSGASGTGSFESLGSKDRQLVAPSVRGGKER